jgi:hypothetical protein
MGLGPGKTKRHKKTAGGAGGFGEIRYLIQVRSTLSTAAGAGEPTVAKEESH